MRVRVSYPPNNSTSGLQVDIDSIPPPPPPPSSSSSLSSSFTNAYLDVFGSGFWPGLPAGARLLSGTVLPFKVRHFPATSRTATLLSFVVGGYRLKHDALRSALQRMVDAGDAQFAMQMLTSATARAADATVWFTVYTRASLMLQSLEQQADNIHISSHVAPALLAPRRRARSNLYYLLRWWWWPLTITALCWSLLVSPDETLSRAPPSITWWMVGTLSPNGSFHDAVLPIPDTRSVAWQLGRIHERTLNNNNKDIPDDDSAMVRALVGAAAGRTDDVNVTHLSAMYDSLVDTEAHRSVLSRVVGVFSFVNLMWLLAIIGIAVSVGPVLYLVLTPLRRLIMRVSVWMWRHVVVPAIEFGHEWGVFEAIMYTVCASFIVDGVRMHPETGMYVSLTGVTLTAPSFAYSTARWASRIKSDDGNIRLMISVWLVSFLLPLAVAYHSLLLGYICVFAFYNALGFSVLPFGMCYLIGFDSKRTLERVAATSGLLLVTICAMKVSGTMTMIDSVDVLVRPLMVMGTQTYFLALLIAADRRYAPTTTTLMQRNLVLVVSLLGAAYIGFVYHMDGMTNTTITYLVLFCVEKYVDVHTQLKWNAWVLMLVSSCACYYTALWLHRHPHFIVSMFQ